MNRQKNDSKTHIETGPGRTREDWRQVSVFDFPEAWLWILNWAENLWQEIKPILKEFNKFWQQEGTDIQPELCQKFGNGYKKSVIKVKPAKKYSNIYLWGSVYIVQINLYSGWVYVNLCKCYSITNFF